jgi:hypothetical protein
LAAGEEEDEKMEEEEEVRPGRPEVRRSHWLTTE